MLALGFIARARLVRGNADLVLFALRSKTTWRWVGRCGLWRRQSLRAADLEGTQVCATPSGIAHAGVYTKTVTSGE